MHLRQTMIFSLPLLLTSSLALAQQAPAKNAGENDQSGQQQRTQTKNKKNKGGDANKDQKGEKSTTILGKKVTNKDEDLDVSVTSQTRTTSAEPPRRDVVESRAEEIREAQGKRWSAAPLLGYGTNDMGLGLGARAGYTFETPIYVGGSFLYHFGTDNVGSAAAFGVTENRRTFYYPAVEAGYDIGIGPVLVRPYGGLGILFAHDSVTTNGQSASGTENALMLYPGVTAQYLFPRSPFFVGGDTRVLLPFAKQGAAFNIFATAGLQM
jgi:hypothetical protein